MMLKKIIFITLFTMTLSYADEGSFTKCGSEGFAPTYDESNVSDLMDMAPRSCVFEGKTDVACGKCLEHNRKFSGYDIEVENKREEINKKLFAKIGENYDQQYGKLFKEIMDFSEFYGFESDAELGYECSANKIFESVDCLPTQYKESLTSSLKNLNGLKSGEITINNFGKCEIDPNAKNQCQTDCFAKMLEREEKYLNYVDLIKKLANEDDEKTKKTIEFELRKHPGAFVDALNSDANFKRKILKEVKKNPSITYEEILALGKGKKRGESLKTALIEKCGSVNKSLSQFSTTSLCSGKKLKVNKSNNLRQFLGIKEKKNDPNVGYYTGMFCEISNEDIDLTEYLMELPQLVAAVDNSNAKMSSRACRKITKKEGDKRVLLSHEEVAAKFKCDQKKCNNKQLAILTVLKNLEQPKHENKEQTAIVKAFIEGEPKVETPVVAGESGASEESNSEVNAGGGTSKSSSGGDGSTRSIASVNGNSDVSKEIRARSGSGSYTPTSTGSNASRMKGLYDRVAETMDNSIYDQKIDEVSGKIDQLNNKYTKNLEDENKKLRDMVGKKNVQGAGNSPANNTQLGTNTVVDEDDTIAMEDGEEEEELNPFDKFGGASDLDDVGPAGGSVSRKGRKGASGGVGAKKVGFKTAKDPGTDSDVVSVDTLADFSGEFKLSDILTEKEIKEILLMSEQNFKKGKPFFFEVTSLEGKEIKVQITKKDGVYNFKPVSLKPTDPMFIAVREELTKIMKSRKHFYRELKTASK